MPDGAQPSRRLRGRIVGGGLLVAAVAAVVALDTVVPLPLSSPRVPSVRRAVTVDGPAPSVTPSDVTAPADEADVDRLLAAFTQQLSGPSGTGEEFVVPGQADVAAAVTRFARNVRAVPDTNASLSRDATVALTPGTGGTLRGRLVVTTFMPGVNPATGAVDVSFERSGGQWLLSSWQPVPGTDKVPANHALLDGDVVGLRTPHVVLVASPATGALNARLARRLEAAATQVRAVLPEPAWDGRVVVYAFTDKAFLDGVFGPARPGVTPRQDLRWWDFAYDGGESRLVVAPGYLLGDTTQTRQGLRSVIADRAAMATGSDDVPHWMREGLVAYAATRTDGPSDGATAIAETGLFDPTWAKLKKHAWKPVLRVDYTPEPTDEEYDSAFFAWHYVVDTRGEATARQLWEAAIDAVGAPEVREKEALKVVLGTTPQAFRAQVAKYADRIAAKA